MSLSFFQEKDCASRDKRNNSVTLLMTCNFISRKKCLQLFWWNNLLLQLGNDDEKSWIILTPSFNYHKGCPIRVTFALKKLPAFFYECSQNCKLEFARFMPLLVESSKRQRSCFSESFIVNYNNKLMQFLSNLSHAACSSSLSPNAFNLCCGLGLNVLLSFMLL